MKPSRAPAAFVPPKAKVTPINFHGQPERKCGNCQHWGPERGTRDRTKVCHNGISQRVQAHERDSCDLGWYPSVSRFPIEKVFNP
jgi:hypothetical protein